MIPFDSFEAPRRIASASFDPALKRKPQSRRDASVREAAAAQKEATAEESNKLEVVEDDMPLGMLILSPGLKKTWVRLKRPQFLKFKITLEIGEHLQ